MVIVLHPPACFARLVCIQSVSIRDVYQFTETGSTLVLRLIHLEFDSLIPLWSWFNYLLLLTHLLQKFLSRTEKVRGKSGITFSLFDTNLERLACGGSQFWSELQFYLCTLSVSRVIETFDSLRCSFPCAQYP